MINLELVDNFAQTYGYTHTQVLNLELEFVYNLLWLHAEQSVEANNYKALKKQLS